ncbi:hypothetical protein BBK82_21755 [Lentzea guizhouensis]|uniref:TIR domain-containing protein n=1 Tax=Lentzea guizhouensis TaxID=1586287 RepID=A0A1B2HKQ1_9PSEU|nr:TIR domain-containing protein [Lentzea guizhouensis]ANZ38299.1 hypothetical protein BBK82_21755 [Lentzea guizhouensis]
MGGTFLNYRRHDERIGLVRTLYERLVERFGENNVFLDSATIGHGRRYPNQLRRHLGRSDVVVVVVHPGWASELKTDGTDWVHNEIRWALAAGKTIIPLLLEGAKMPRAQELPRSIRELANFQAHRLRDDPGHAALCEKIAAEPQRRAAVGETPARPWAAPLAGLLGAAAFTVPVVAVPASARETAFAAGLFGIIVLVATLIAVSVVLALRKPVNAAEQLAQDLDPSRYYLLVAAPAGTLLVAMTAAIVFSSPVEPGFRPFLVLVTGFAVLYLVFLVIGQYKLEKFREDHWPVRLTEPVKPAPVRRELERLLRRHRSAGDQDRVRWHLRHLENAADVLARDASRTWWSWLTADHFVVLQVGAVWTAGSLGFLTAAALPAMVLWLPATALVVTAGALWGIIAAAYRRQSWVRRNVADEVQIQIQRIQDGSPQPSA